MYMSSTYIAGSITVVLVLHNLISVGIVQQRPKQMLQVSQLAVNYTDIVKTIAASC